MNAISERDFVLGRIRKSLADVPSTESPEDTPIPRDYRTTSTLPRWEILELFIERVADYKAIVTTVRPEALHPAIAASLSARGVKRLVVPADLPESWTPAGLTILRDPGLTIDQLETSDGVLTGCAIGIAQTGTIILDGGPTQGRRILSLLPDYHLCVVRADQVVGLVPEAITLLQPNRPTTFISGPSATSDIELNRVEGVHGPRTLEVLVVTSDT